MRMTSIYLCIGNQNKSFMLQKEEKDDCFFQPKNIQTRMEKIIELDEKIVAKIKLGLKRIKDDYKNKKWETDEEKLFLRIFSNLYLVETYDKENMRWYFNDEQNKTRVCLNLEINITYISQEYIWIHFEAYYKKDIIAKFGLIRLLLKTMFKKYFELKEIDNCNIIRWDWCSFFI